MKILFVDDDSKIHLVMGLWLKRNQHDFTSARNGQEALAKLKDEEFDVLITDVNMPLVNGIELVTAVLEQPIVPGMIVVLTSRCDAMQLQENFKSPRVRVFSKPFSPAMLTELIQKFDSEQVAKT